MLTNLELQHPFQEDTEKTLTVEETQLFQKDLKHLSAENQRQINKKINSLIALIQDSNFNSIKHKLQKIKIELTHYHASIYSFKVNRDLRILLFFDDDPLFNQTIITLLRVVHQNNRDKVIKGLAESYYQQELLTITPNKNGR
ncbi:hypothetical protein PN462_19195 [Spirulina sp. CS-785/01]|uniref:type II toxin-antitoxin system RelE family toxin n=1 Tax=Spirulina sp. CS-785/01 TaxID=3021716 RepID=UPI0023306E13|nr:hypothetical protein [Spirulina sp. CS-785/01]MDB9315249.1 hypothetical protein [Spirulina sp. CS-785/01]